MVTLPLREHNRAKFRVKLDIAILSINVYLGGTLASAELLGTALGCPLPHSQQLEEEPLNNVLLKRQLPSLGAAERQK